jgi:propionyl-CoA carboxylase beta chain
MPEPAVQPAHDDDLARLWRERRVAAEVDAGRATAPGRLTPRQRVESLVDDGSFLELGALAASQQPTAAGPTPGDGLLTGFGTVGGRQVAVISEDPLVLGRSDGQVAKSKRRRLLKLALQQQLPVVFLADGPSGPLLQFPAGQGELFGGLAEQHDDPDMRRRRAESIGVVLGPVGGQAGELLVECDLVVQTSRTPPDPAHPVADVVVSDDTDAVRIAADVIRQAGGAGSGTGPSAACGEDRAGRAGPPGQLSGVPASEGIAPALADAGSWMPFTRDPGSGLVTGMLRLGGIPAAIGTTGARGVRQLVPADIRRLRRITDLSERLSAPLILVQDCDGYSPEIMGDPRSASSLADLVARLRSLTVPLLCLVAGAGHVLGTFCLGARQLGPWCVLAWPWAGIGVVDTPGYETATIAPHRQPGPWLAAGMGLVDDVLTPEETGPWLRWFVALWNDRRHVAPPQLDERWYARSSIKGT